MNHSPKIHVGALAIGVAVDLGPALAIGGLFGAVQGFRLASQGVAREELEARLVEQLTSPETLVISLVLGLVSTLLAGYVAARIAGRGEVLHAAIVGGLGLIVSLLLLLPEGFDSYPEWFIWISFLLAVPVAVLGGILAKSRGRTTTVQLHRRTDRHFPRVDPRP